eukprot:CAMPEP_0202714468 /NCGR_PEP_ID=MMETSP1385-20130828/74032_1 /ASSEMBLY_ACC=CAM_ASM_000861 /TAXON_ID=933848 /ORGANISM="Elphidium margaritaceum" /LENGTH=33 /DNA_ID= /DNA_START= /DNA_END= /DNA_ORIENTATION=
MHRKQRRQQRDHGGTKQSAGARDVLDQHLHHVD